MGRRSGFEPSRERELTSGVVTLVAGLRGWESEGMGKCLRKGISYMGVFVPAEGVEREVV